MSHMSRREFLARSLRGAAAAGLGAGLAPAALQGEDGASLAGGESAPPNVVILTADDLGFSDLGCYGAEIDTPNLDRLARAGLRFTRFYNTPRCSPSRASLLTGLYPHQVGVGHLAGRDYGEPGYRGRLSSRCVTMAEMLGRAGYRTYMTGKWHVGTDRSTWPTRRGFDRFYGEHSYVDAYFRPTNQLWLDGQKMEPRGEDWYTTDAYTDWALRFLDQAEGEDRPFLLYVAYNAPHFPLQAFQEDLQKYRGRYTDGWDALRLRRHERLVEEGLIDERWTLSPRSERPEAPAWRSVSDQEGWDRKMAAYAAQVDRLDRNIGRIVDRLRRKGELENTLVLFFSDNGGCAETWINERNPDGARAGDRDALLAYGPGWANLSNTPFRLYKRWVHEGGTATPMIAHWPRVIGTDGRIARTSSHLIDLLPTLLDIVGMEYPDEREGRPIPPVEGESLLPTFRGEDREGHEILAWEHEGNRGILRGRWKLVQRSRYIDGDWELYDLAADRTETRNLASQDPGRVSKLAGRYRRWADRVGAVPWEELDRSTS